MKACFHKATCKYFNEELDSGECACVVVCKFYVGMDFDELKKKKNKDTPAKEKHKKRHYARRAKKEAEEKNGEEKIKIARDENGASHITEAQIAKARKKIANAGQRGVLTDNQKLALETTCRVRFPDLSDGQKEQIIEIANSLPTK